MSSLIGPLTGKIRGKRNQAHPKELILDVVAATTNTTTASHPLHSSSHTAAMSAPRAITALARARPTSTTYTLARSAFRPATTAAAFSTTSRQNATTGGPPPAGFRPPKPARFNEQKDSYFDYAGNYFMLTEMFRGMYVVLEQFFRPPYVPTPLDATGHSMVLTSAPATQSSTPSRRARSRPASVASTPCAATRPARSAALPASCARPSALRKPSPSRPRSAPTDPAARPATTLT